MSFARLSFVNPGVLIAAAGSVVVLVVVLSRRGCKMRENCKLIGAALVVDVVVGAALVDLMAIGPVF